MIDKSEYFKPFFNIMILKVWIMNVELKNK